MYVIELILRSTPTLISVQRKTVEEAEAVYQQVLAAMNGSGGKIELTCERQPEKKVTVLTSEINALQMYEKSGTPSSGKAPGFVGMNQ